MNESQDACIRVRIVAVLTVPMLFDPLPLSRASLDDGGMRFSLMLPKVRCEVMCGIRFSQYSTYQYFSAFKIGFGLLTCYIVNYFNDESTNI